MIIFAFVCVGNAGRSQMATAYAEQEEDRRGLDIDILTGGIDPAERIHEEVVEILQEDGLDIRGRTPTKIEPADVADVDYLITMGCSIEQFRPEDWDGEARLWDLEASGGEKPGSYRSVRDEISGRVEALFDEITFE